MMQEATPGNQQLTLPSCPNKLRSSSSACISTNAPTLSCILLYKLVANLKLLHYPTDIAHRINLLSHAPTRKFSNIKFSTFTHIDIGICKSSTRCNYALLQSVRLNKSSKLLSTSTKLLPKWLQTEKYSSASVCQQQPNPKFAHDK